MYMYLKDKNCSAILRLFLKNRFLTLIFLNRASCKKDDSVFEIQEVLKQPKKGNIQKVVHLSSPVKRKRGDLDI